MTVRDAILRMKPYTPPLEGRDPKRALLLDFNESLLPPPPHVRQALHDFIESGRLQTYPDYGDFEARMGAALGLSAQQVLITNGSDQGIEVVLRAFLEKGDELVQPVPTFTMYNQIAQTLEARVTSVPFEADMAFPAAALDAAITPQTRMVLVASPNNPTGTLMPRKWLEALLARLPQMPVVVDEAYVDFSGQNFLDLLPANPNLILLRTFSKAYALPALRLGLVLAHGDLVTHLKKIRGPYDVNMLAVTAAGAQLDDPAPMRAYIREVMTVSKPLVEEYLARRGVAHYPSAANFILIRPKDVPTVVNHLRDQGIRVRAQHPPIQDCFRVTLGPQALMQKLLASLENCPGLV